MDLLRLRQATVQVGVRADSWIELGTGFIAPVYRPYEPFTRYALSAAHVVAESAARAESLVVRDHSGREYRVSVALRTDPEPGMDFALLEFASVLDVLPLPCSDSDTRCNVSIRGAALGVETAYSTLAGRCSGVEEHRQSGRAVLDLALDDVRPDECSDEHVWAATAHATWAGISGAPIVAVGPDGTMRSAIGILTRIASGGAARRVYGTPMRTVRDTCALKGLDFEFVPPLSDVERLGRIFVGDIFRGLEDTRREQAAWQAVSFKLYSGHDSEPLLAAMRDQPATYRLEPADVGFLEYFRARLLLKRGRIGEGLRALARADTFAAASSSDASARLTALTAARRTPELVWTRAPEGALRSFAQARAALTALRRVDDSYIRAVLASLLDWQSTRLFALGPEKLPEVAAFLRESVSRHEALYRSSPIELAKQDVVVTSLRALSFLRGLDPSGDAHERIGALAQQGAMQSRVRRNSIFFAQMMLLKGMALWMAADRSASRVLLASAGLLLGAGGISLSHEGVGQLVECLGAQSRSARALLEYAHRLGGPARSQPTPGDRRLTYEPTSSLGEYIGEARERSSGVEWSSLYERALEDFFL